MTIAVQVNGKLRDTLTAPKGAPRETLEEMALASEKVRADPRRQAAAQGDRRARPAGEPGRMRRALAPRARCCSLCRLRPAAALRRRRHRARSRRRCAAVEVAPIAGRAGWLVRTALEDRLGNGAGRRAALPARGRARRRHHRLRHPRRRCGDPRAADAARPLPAGRRRARHGAARRHRRLGRRHRRRLAPNMPPSPPSRPRSSGCRSRSPTRSSPGSRSSPRAAGAGAVKANRAADRAGAAARRPTTRFFLLHGPDEAGSRALVKTLGDGDGRRRRADRPQRRRAQGRSGPARRRGGLDLDVRRRALDPGRAGRRRDASPRSRRCSRRRRPAIRWRSSPARSSPPRSCSSWRWPRPRRWPSPATCPTAREADRLVPELARGAGPDRPRRRRPPDRRGLRRQPRGHRAGARQVRALPRRRARARRSRSTMTSSTRSAPAATRATSAAWSTASSAATPRCSRPSCARLRAEGMEGITLIRAVLRRMTLLARLRAEVERAAASLPSWRHGQIIVLEGEGAVERCSCGAGGPICSPRR